MRLRFLLPLLFSCPFLLAQGEFYEGDLDDLFEEEGDIVLEEDSGGPLDINLFDGINLAIKYDFIGGYSPGLTESPWWWENYGGDHRAAVGMDIRADFILMTYINENFKVRQVFRMNLPAFAISVDELWGEYNIFSKAYFKIGRFEDKWGISPNYSYTNLLARTPAERDYVRGKAFTMKVNAPIGIGGIQFVTLGRMETGWTDLTSLRPSDLGYGFKYNYAREYLDLDLGALYQGEMPLRAFLSAKTTLWKTELYSEGLVALEEGERFPLFSGSVGLVQGFWGDRFLMNLEYFYNGEEGISFVVDDDLVLPYEEISPFLFGHNLALNLYFRPSGRFYLGLQSQFNMTEKTGKLIPGMSYNIAPGLEASLAVPFAVGGRQGSYYRENYDLYGRPFALALGLTLRGTQSTSLYPLPPEGKSLKPEPSGRTGK